VVVGLVFSLLYQPRFSAFDYLIILVITLGIPIWVFTQTFITEKRRYNSVNYLLDKDFLSSVVIYPSAYYLLKEKEDEGTHYWLEVGDNEVVTLGGPRFPSSRKFPSEEIEIAEGRGPKDELVFYKVYCRGRRLEPSRIISGEEKWRYFESKFLPDPEEVTFVNFSLEELFRRVSTF
jgi:hypothetical protein